MNKKKFLSFVLSLTMISTSFSFFGFGSTYAQENSISSKELIASGLKANETIKVFVETKNIPALERYNKMVFNRNLDRAVLGAKKDVAATTGSIINNLEKKGTKIDETYEYSSIAAGFSADVKVKDIDLLVKNGNVKRVVPQLMGRGYQENTTGMNSSTKMVNAPIVWDTYGFKGEGMVVSVIDSGFDPTHKDYKITDITKAKYDKNGIEKLIGEKKLPGKYISDKLIYGYNYLEGNTDIRNPRNNHGHHVAGTVAANGEIKGVAPEAQILAMKTFPSDGQDNVWEEVWVKAMDDSIALGADVINMSLGDVAGFIDQNASMSAAAIKRADQNGVVVAICQGNDKNPAWGNIDANGNQANNLIKNPDQGTGWQPAIFDGSMSVAAFENTRTHRTLLKLSGVPEDVLVKYGFENGEIPGDMTDIEGSFAPKQMVYKELGFEAQYGENENLNGKVALVDRGEGTFADKYDAAINHGASAVVIMDNNPDSNFSHMTGINLQKGKPISLVIKKYGDMLKALLADYPEVKIEKVSGLKSVPNDEAWKIAVISSWGPAPDLTLKPDIAAPGGQIYSLAYNNSYETMTGTSMATPHVAGANAVLIQRLYADGLVNKSEKSIQDDLSKLILMNTATILEDKDGGNKSYYSPLQMGAGLLNLEAAIKDYVTVTGVSDNDKKIDGKIELGEVGNSEKVKLELKNYGTNPISYDVKYIVLAEKFDDGENKRYTENSTIIKEEVIDSIDLRASETKTADYTLNFEDVAKNQFAMGYIILTPKENSPKLSIPFMGFKGDWTDPRIIDSLIDNGKEEANFKGVIADNGYYDKTGFVRESKEQGWDYWNNWTINGKDTIFVNSQENEKYQTNMVPVLSFLRNATNVTFQIGDQSNKWTRQLGLETRVKKVNRLIDQRYNFENKLSMGAWDFTDDKGNPVNEGRYIYTIKSNIDSEKATAANRQTDIYNIVLDNTAPTVTAKYDKNTNKVIIEAKDNLSGINSLGVEFDNYEAAGENAPYIEHVVDKSASPMETTYNYSIDLADHMKNHNLHVYVWDNSRNITTVDIEGLNKTENEVIPEKQQKEEQQEQQEQTQNQDIKVPDIAEEMFLSIDNSTPRMNQIFGGDKIHFKGSIEGLGVIPTSVEIALYDKEARNPIKGVKTLKITEFVKDKEDITSNLFEGDFDIKGVPEGHYRIKFKAISTDKKEIIQTKYAARSVRIDTNKPVIQVDTNSFKVTGNKAEFKFNASDTNYNYLEVFVNNNMIDRIDNTYFSLDPSIGTINKDYTFTQKLLNGENKITIKLYDDLGKDHETISEIIFDYANGQISGLKIDGKEVK